MKVSVTVETRINKTKFFLSSLDRFLISGLVLFIPACKVLNKVFIYSTCYACICIVFSTRILMIPEEHFEVRSLVK